MYFILFMKFGQLGTGTNQQGPAQVIGSFDPLNIYAGLYNLYIQSKNGSVYGCGYYQNYLLPLWDATSPRKLQHFERIIQISSSGRHTLFLSNSSQVYGFGGNQQGELGLGTISQFVSPPQMIPFLNNVSDIYTGYFHSIVITNNGSVYCFGYNNYGQLGLGDLIYNMYTNIESPTFNIFLSYTNITKISLGYYYSIVFENDELVLLERIVILQKTPVYPL